MARFKPGQSGNPNGKPVGTISYKNEILKAFIKVMDKEITDPDTGDKAKFYDAFLDKLMKDALEGKFDAKMFFAERLLKPDILDTIDNYINRGAREDTDFLSYRIYKDCHDIQQQILLSKNKYIYAMAGRRSGKTEIAKDKGVEKAISKEGSRILYIGLSFTRCIELFWNKYIERVTDLGMKPKEQRRTEGLLVLPNGSEIHFVGNTTVDERDKLRGSQWDLVVIDEAQSQKALAVLIEEILEPTLLDRKGQLMLCGTGPRVRGTYWEEIWTDTEKHKAARFNWNITANPFIPDYEKVLAAVLEEKQLTVTSPLYIREYLGQICYDDDALVYRLTDANWYQDDQLAAWINSQPIADIHFSAGLDYGFEDSDAFAIVMFSSSKPERFLMYEYKGNRTGITELADEMKRGIQYIASHPMLKSVPDASRFFYIYADTGGAGKKISSELQTQYSLPVADAFKANKDMAIELLQEETRLGEFKVRQDGIFSDEALKVVFARNDRDDLTRIIDDEAFHPDMVDAILYAMRFIWINYPKK